jgi:hypothetical protein
MTTSNGTAPVADLLEQRYQRIAADDAGNPRTYSNKTKALDLLGTAEAAYLLGVERPRIGRWISKGVMPMPVVWLAAGPIWRREHIEAMRDEVEARKRHSS